MVLINRSQILLPNDYQRNIDYIHWRETLVDGGAGSLQLRQNIFKKRTQKNRTLLRDNPDSGKTQRHTNMVFSSSKFISKKKIYFDCNCQYINPLFYNIRYLHR